MRAGLDASGPCEGTAIMAAPVASLPGHLHVQVYPTKYKGPPCLTEMGKLTKNLDNYGMVWTVTTETQQGTYNVCAEEMTFLPLAMNEYERLVQGVQFSSINAVKIVKAIGNCMAVII
jgi:hypothetical protein